MAEPTPVKHKLETSHGFINVSDWIPLADTPEAPLILLLHGNSFCLKIWKHIFASDLAKSHRIIAIDYPGHGDSSDANDPEESYNMPAYADAALQVLQILAASKSIIVVGWSLGGHVAIEIVLRCNRVKGIMITGTPPVDTADEINKAFTLGDGGWENAIAARAKLTHEEIDGFAHGCADPPYEDWMLACVKRTDGRARELMFKAFANGNKESLDSVALKFPAFAAPGGKPGQKCCVETSEVPVAVVNGKNEPFVNLEWIKQIKFKNLWGGECIEMEGCLHAPFWGKPKEYQEILERFVKDVS